MKKLQCEICGGNLVKDGEYFSCVNCGSQYTPEAAKKMVLELDGPIKIDGPLTVSGVNDATQLIVNARTFLKLERFDEAEKALTDSINQDPNNAEAYYLRLMATHKLSGEIRWENVRDIHLETLQDYRSAKLLGDEEIKSKLISASERNWRNLCQDALLTANNPSYITNITKSAKIYGGSMCLDLVQQCYDKLEALEQARLERRAAEDKERELRKEKERREEANRKRRIEEDERRRKEEERRRNEEWKKERIKQNIGTVVGTLLLAGVMIYFVHLILFSWWV